MAMGSRFRIPSPEPRTVIDPKVSTTGNVPPTMEANLHEIRPRPNHDGTFSTSLRAQHDSRRPTENHPQPSKVYRIPGHSTTTRTEYTTRPRSRTSLEGGRRPWSLVIPSSPSRAIVTSDYERSPGSKHPGYYTNVDSDCYLMPASTRSRRRTLSTNTKDGRLAPVHKDSSPHSDRGGYLTTGGRSRTVYPVSRAEYKSQDIDVNDAYSYTNLKEELLRNSPKREHRREGLVRRPRPVSLTGLEGYSSHAWRDPRHGGPSGLSHAFDKFRRDDDRREVSQGNGSEASRVSDVSRRHASQRAPVSLHQERTKPRYRDERDRSKDERGYRIRREGDDTIVVEDHPYSSARDEPSIHRTVKSGRSDSDSVHMAHGGLATAGLASGYSPEARDKHSDRDISPRREHRRVRRSPRVHTSSDTDDTGSGASTGRRRHRTSRRPREDTLEIRPAVRHESRHNEKAREDIERRSPVSSQKNSPEMRQRTDADASPPKGILKAPTQKFPEDATAVREGVAPLKDSTKKGIPTGARWTKIARRLVNPAALEGHERFEERPDCVIVLRVLTKEEIQAYANKTAEIRSRYYRNSPRNSPKEKHKEDDRRYGRSNRHSTDSDDEYDNDDDNDDDDDDQKKLPAIEPPPDSKR